MFSTGLKGDRIEDKGAVPRTRRDHQTKGLEQEGITMLILWEILRALEKG